jgi:hypothetical protein
VLFPRRVDFFFRQNTQRTAQAPAGILWANHIVNKATICRYERMIEEAFEELGIDFEHGLEYDDAASAELYVDMDHYYAIMSIRKNLSTEGGATNV